MTKHIIKFSFLLPTPFSKAYDWLSTLHTHISTRTFLSHPNDILKNIHPHLHESVKKLILEHPLTHAIPIVFDDSAKKINIVSLTCGSPEYAANLVQIYLLQFNITEAVGFTWISENHTLTPPTFQGGAYVITYDEIIKQDAADWMNGMCDLQNAAITTHLKNIQVE